MHCCALLTVLLAYWFDFMIVRGSLVACVLNILFVVCLFGRFGGYVAPVLRLLLVCVRVACCSLVCWCLFVILWVCMLCVVWCCCIGLVDCVLFVWFCWVFGVLLMWVLLGYDSCGWI